MKIPKNAKRVFKGIIFDVYQWQQEMFDGSRQTFEMLKRPDTVEVIATAGGKIWLARQSQPTKSDFYALFGGRAEEGEEPLESARRELAEESGLTSDDCELWRAYKPIHKMDWTIYTYIARNCKKTAELKLDAGEKIRTETVSFDKFVSIVESDKFWGAELVMDILRMKLNKEKMAEFKKRLF